MICAEMGYQNGVKTISSVLKGRLWHEKVVKANEVQAMRGTRQKREQIIVL
jgi:hypothetical protein